MFEALKNLISCFHKDMKYCIVKFFISNHQQPIFFHQQQLMIMTLQKILLFKHKYIFAYQQDWSGKHDNTHEYIFSNQTQLVVYSYQRLKLDAYFWVKIICRYQAYMGYQFVTLSCTLPLVYEFCRIQKRFQIKAYFNQLI